MMSRIASYVVALTLRRSPTDPCSLRTIRARLDALRRSHERNVLLGSWRLEGASSAGLGESMQRAQSSKRGGGAGGGSARCLELWET